MATATPEERESRFVELFLKLSGYEQKDIHGSNPKTRRVVTTNGGLYVVNPDRTIRTIAGPVPPNER